VPALVHLLSEPSSLVMILKCVMDERLLTIGERNMIRDADVPFVRDD
jgi:hypothetical protein